ncbi:MAG: hypothetical protein LBP23_00280 [Treponema sp.]|jgi:hypothetical protein|nr:hypothetical protein [Treponema sp.]
MNDIEPAEPYGSAKSLAKQGVTAVGCIAGGLFLFVMNVIGTRFPVAGIVLGVAAAVIGIGALFSRDPDDRKRGAVITAAGALVILSRVGIPFIRLLAGTLLGIGAFGLLAMGIWNGIKFFRGLKSRS